MLVFVEQWYICVLILFSLYTLCVITATAAGNKVSKHLEGA